ncbi:chromate efflux transporter [Rugamonas aquatica]|uniref:Chromate efflux transporter n=1 Tax=Rugamonas aquatica TaxID=2743357 RepID=A0A6A7MZ85_9BURK|nr:chromate efflux transporter [Rugamonas aquatica]MQA38047.1 chromate efflux transporter [Rugamonas aquatica]
MTSSSAPAAPTLWQAFRFWLKLGCISFGGPAGQIAIMHQELVERRRWISERRFLHALNYCMLLPGPEAQQLATYIGWLLHRTRGGIIAGALFVLPSLLLLVLLSWLYIAYGQQPLLAGLFYGIKPAVTAIVLQAAHRIGTRALRNGWLWAIAGAAFVAVFALQLPFPLIVAGAALAGYLGGRYLPHAFKIGGGHGAAKASYGAAVIDDETPPPPHARFRWRGLVLVSACGALLWLAPMALLMWAVGWQHTYTQMAWFFTKAALLTFGGAYAVLPYVYQGAVAHYGWLTPLQMMDGLALGETTPGPLIMVVAFVGFVGGYGLAPSDALAAPLSGAVAATLVTWFTFLPSFVFILAGGPLVEATRDDLNFTAPLTGITAAVVGVILNLALFFAWHVIWPTGFDGAPDWAAAAIALAAAVALLRYRQKVPHVIAACAVVGLVLRQLAP